MPRKQEENPMTLAAKLVEVAQECAYVQKDARNDFHKYRYVSAATILEKVNDALTKRKIAQTVVPEIVSVVEKVVTVRVTITLIDAESAETLTTVGLGSGTDTGDKAVMKAETAAIKYCWMLALNISTGDDPEADATTDAPTPPPKPIVRPPLPPKLTDPIVKAAPPPEPTALYHRVVAIRNDAVANGATGLPEIPQGWPDSTYADWIVRRSAQNPLVAAAAERITE
jgi:hypothetical protein